MRFRASILAELLTISLNPYSIGRYSMSTVELTLSFRVNES